MSKQTDSPLILRSINYRPLSSDPPDRYPFNLPVIEQLPELTFDAPVTFFVGENGSGKSTLMEGIACAANAITVGSEQARRDKSLSPIHKFAWQLSLSWSKRSHRGFFLRAEDFFGYAKRLNQMREELERELQVVDSAYQGRSKMAVDLAKSPYQRELHALEERYGEGLDNRSHGESFLHLFQERFIPGGLYLLDEPEAPLSPLRQLTFLAMMREMIDQNAQFIIATHSPILLAYPGAAILSFDSVPLRQVEYESLEHVRLTRDFLRNPDLFLKHL